MITLDTIHTKYTPIGLDIGTGGIRAAQIECAHDRYIVTRTMGMERSFDDPSDTHTLHERLNLCIRHGVFTTRNVITAPVGGNVEYYPLELPETIFVQQSETVEQAIHWELGRITKESPTNMTTAHWRLPASTALHHNTIGVAVRTDCVGQTLDLCSSAGLVCTCIDTPTTALCRLGCLLRDRSNNVIWGMLDVGYEQSRLFICVDETPVLVRDAGVGSHVWTKRIARSLSLGEKAAEIHKKEHGITLAHSSESREIENELSTILMELLKSDLNELATEIKRSYEYILGCYPNRKATELILVGGGSALHNLPEYLSSVLGISVQRASDYVNREDCRLQFDTGENPSLDIFALAVGLALGNG